MSERTPSSRLPTLPRLLVDQLAYHTRLLLRTPRAVVGGMLLPILLLLLRGGTAHVTHLERVKLVAGLVAFGALSTAYITHTASLVAARQAGVLKRWRVTPLPAWCYFAGRIAAVALLAVIGGALTTLVATAHDHIPLSLGTIADLSLILTLGAATWASIGTAASALIPTTEAAWPLLGATYLPLVILSGGLGVVSGQPAGWPSASTTYRSAPSSRAPTTRSKPEAAYQPLARATLPYSQPGRLRAWRSPYATFAGRQEPPAAGASTSARDHRQVGPPNPDIDPRHEDRGRPPGRTPAGPRAKPDRCDRARVSGTSGRDRELPFVAILGSLSETAAVRAEQPRHRRAPIGA